MVYVTGDCHGDYRRFDNKEFPEQKEMTRDDYVIVCGDFGYWDKSSEQEWWRKWLARKPFTLLFVDGNHENFDMLKELPVREWHGGKIQKIKNNVFHLMRGQVFEIEGKKFFTFGGARSHDISDGILEPDDPEFRDKYRTYSMLGYCFRVNHESWWKEEMPSEEEFAEGIANLERNDWKVDYIISHCASNSCQALAIGGWGERNQLTDYFDMIQQRCEYKEWFFGHYHDNRRITEKDTLLYENIVRIL